MARRGTGRLDVGREAKADIATLGQRVGLLLAKAFVVKDFHGLLEGLDRRHMVVGHAVGVEVRHLVAAQQVLAAQVDRVHVHLAGGDVQQHLARQGLVLPWSAIRGEARGVREHGLVVEAGLGHPVRAGEEHADGGGRQHRIRRRVRPDVVGEVDVDGEDVAVVIERHPRRCRRRAGPVRPTSDSRDGPRSTSARRAPCARPA